MPDKLVKSTLKAKDNEISLFTTSDNEDYISLTDIAKYRDAENPRFIIQNWMRTRSTVEFLGVWESLNNPNFNRVDFEAVKNEAGSNGFVLTPTKWINLTNSIGIRASSGRYGGGTFAHKDIAFEFASWISPEFKLYIIQDYQRLKSDESYQLAYDWSVKRILSKANYRIHTDAIKENLIPPNITKKQEGFIYADEADLLNVALFGKTASQWRKENPGKQGNIRDMATIEQLLVLTNLENANALLIKQGKSQRERLIILNTIARQQIATLTGTKSVNELNKLNNQKPLKLEE